MPALLCRRPGVCYIWGFVVITSWPMSLPCAHFAVPRRPGPHVPVGQCPGWGPLLFPGVGVPACGSEWWLGPPWLRPVFVVTGSRTSSLLSLRGALGLQGRDPVGDADVWGQANGHIALGLAPPLRPL